ncbi:catalase family peroxidase [Micromonospora chersina]|uniref:catalase family peroxidase n=1 Tax=Micromonospora chersina TaxID=47854 RepID=UPI00371F2EF7
MITSRNRIAIAEDEPIDRLPARLVQDLHAAFGEHHARAVHAKGTIVRGAFTPDPGAANLCRAQLFREHQVPVVARFSNFTGLPHIPDNEITANPRGLAIKFLMPDGSNLDIVNHSFNGFPVSTSEEFSQLLQAIAGSDGEPTPGSDLERFLANHPAAKAFLTTQNTIPDSWATTSYYSVNAVQFTNDRGEIRFARYQFVPQTGEQHRLAPETTAVGPDFLLQEMDSRISAGPIRFTWYAQLAENTDVVDDPAITWPDDRPRVPLGVLTITEAGPNSAEADQALAFMPGTLPPGIEAADPMLTIRNASYPYSFRDRNR